MNRKNEYDYGYMPSLILLSLTDRILRGLQTDLNLEYNNKHRVKPEVNIEYDKKGREFGRGRKRGDYIR